VYYLTKYFCSSIVQQIPSHAAFWVKLNPILCRLTIAGRSFFVSLIDVLQFILQQNSESDSQWEDISSEEDDGNQVFVATQLDRLVCL